MLDLNRSDYVLMSIHYLSALLNLDQSRENTTDLRKFTKANFRYFGNSNLATWEGCWKATRGQTDVDESLSYFVQSTIDSMV